jgi:anti-sigma B factor antagonist
MSAELSFTTNSMGGDVEMIALTGEIDYYTGPRLERAVTELLDGACRGVVVDLADVSFLDSTGVNILLVAHKRLSRSGGRLAVVCPNPAVGRVFDLLSLRDLLGVVDSRDRAFALVAQS